MLERNYFCACVKRYLAPLDGMKVKIQSHQMFLIGSHKKEKCTIYYLSVKKCSDCESDTRDVCVDIFCL